MAIVIINDEYLSDIADAIREKNGLTETYKPNEMAAAIIDIPGGGDIEHKLLQTNDMNWKSHTVNYDISDYEDCGKVLIFMAMADWNVLDASGAVTGTESGNDILAITIGKTGVVKDISLAGTSPRTRAALSDAVTATYENGVVTVTANYDDLYVKGTVQFTKLAFSPLVNLYYVQ